MHKTHGTFIMRTHVIAFLVLTVAIGGTAAASDRLYRLPIGDPARKDREVPVVLDTMIDTASGKTLAPSCKAADGSVSCRC